VLINGLPTVRSYILDAEGGNTALKKKRLDRALTVVTQNIKHAAIAK
jgi:hypothetical protein